MRRNTSLHLLTCIMALAMLAGELTAAAAGPQPGPAARARPAVAVAAPETVYRVYLNSGPVAINRFTTCGGGEIVRTFNVTHSFTVVDVRVGFNANHEARGDLRVSLKSPAGTQIEIINASSNNISLNYNLKLDDASTNPIDDGGYDETNTDLYDYGRLARPRNPFSVFSGQNSAGTWTLYICDTYYDPLVPTDGTYNRSQLELAPAPDAATLRATNTADKLAVARGMVITYNVILRNVGLTAAAGATLTDNIPAGTSYVPGSLNTQGSPPAIFNGGAITWSGTVGSEQSIGITFQVKVDDAATGYIANTATISHASLPVALQPFVVSQVFTGQDYLYTNETDYAIPDTECATSVAAPITVSDRFAVAGVRVGITLDHTFRGDLSATLTSPAGTQVQLITPPAAGGNTANYDILLDSASSNPFDDGTEDNIGIPFYDRTAAPASPLTVLAGQNPVGAWTLHICDGNLIDDGTLRQWSLFFAAAPRPATPAVTIAKSGNDVRLTWNKVTQNVQGQPVTVTAYEVWRSTKPYFVPDPGDPAVTKLPDVPQPAGSTVSTIDGGVLIGGSNAYYRVIAVAGANVSAPSNRVGAFMVGVVPGSQ